MFQTVLLKTNQKNMKRVWENVSDGRVWRRVDPAPQIWSLCLFAVSVFYLSWGIRFLPIVEPPAIRYCIRGFYYGSLLSIYATTVLTVHHSGVAHHVTEMWQGFLWGLAWQFQLYATGVFIVGSFVRPDWLYAIFVFTKKAVLSHVCFKIKNKYFHRLKISICQQIPHGGVSAIQETPFVFSMGSNSNDLGCHTGKYCKSVAEMQTQVFWCN